MTEITDERPLDVNETILLLTDWLQEYQVEVTYIQWATNDQKLGQIDMEDYENITLQILPIIILSEECILLTTPRGQYKMFLSKNSNKDQFMRSLLHICNKTNGKSVRIKKKKRSKRGQRKDSQIF